MKDRAPISPYRLDWPSALGTFLINFGTLHYLVIVFLKDNLAPTEFAAFKDRHFQDQVKRIERFLREAGFSTEMQEEFTQLHTRLDPLRNLRNHIAHGYMLYRSGLDGEASAVSICLPKDLDLEYSPETIHITFAELLASLDALTKSIERLKRFVGFK
jgi:hypothetical protein